MIAAAAPLWKDGWYREARHLASPNFGVRPPGVEVDLIILHSISLPPGQYGGPEVEQLFTNQLDCSRHPYFDRLQGLEVSAHFFIRRDGFLMQFVSTQARAWHAGVSNHLGRDNCNDFSIGIELEGLEGDTFEPAQYRQLAALCRHLMQQLPIRHLVGHEHVAPGRKLDPGPGFDWRLLQQTMGLPDQYFPSGCASATPPSPQ